MAESAAEGIKTVLHPVPGLAPARAVYTGLAGMPPQAGWSYYVSKAKPAEVTAAGATVKDP